MHPVCLQLLRLILAKGSGGGSCGGGGRRGPRCGGGDWLLHRVAVAPGRDVARGSRGGCVRVLVVGGGGGGGSGGRRVLCVRGSRVVNVRCGGGGRCGRLDVRDDHSRLHKSLRIDIVGRYPVEKRKTESGRSCLLSGAWLLPRSDQTQI